MAFWHRRTTGRQQPELITEFRDEWRSALARQWRLWSHLSIDQQSRLEVSSVGYIDAWRWEAALGFKITDEMRVLVAAQASLLVLELDPDYFRNVGSILLHPTTMVLSGARPSGQAGLMTDQPFAAEGQTLAGGPVVLAWDAVVRDARAPIFGRNVVLHEFAHVLDLVDRMFDGTPPMGNPGLRAQWIDVCTRAFEEVRSVKADSILRDYAGTNPAEFFAVATETFFTRPLALSVEQPALYEVLTQFYLQDPARRGDPPVAEEE